MTPLTSTEISSCEFAITHSLPGVYRDLLQRVGHGATDSGLIVYHPSEIYELYRHHFESAGELYLRYFPIGCDEAEQTIWLVDVASGRVASIWHETHPDDYPEEDWLEPDDWLLTIPSL